MQFNSNLNHDERERLAYLSGNLPLATIHNEATEALARLDGIEDHGIYDEEDARKITAELTAAEERREALAETLEYVLDAVRALLEDDGAKFGTRMRMRLSAVLRDVQQAQVPNDAIADRVAASVER